MSKDLLLVGSGLEAQIAENCLSSLVDGTIHHLPVAAEDERDFAFVRRGLLPQGIAGPELVRLTDVWAKTAVSFSLPDLDFVEDKSLKTPHSLAPGLKVSRTAVTDDGVTAVLSDGTEIYCKGVLFADGGRSQAHKFWDKPVKPRPDPYAVMTWSFVSQNFQELKTWDFRWAAAKTVELIPLPGNRLWTRLRFKSSYGAKLTVPELRELFSEFGSEMTGLFENLSDDSITFCEESKISHAVFTPARGCIALGRAAWPAAPMLTFDWLSRFVEKQMHILSEQVRLDSWNTESFEAQSRELLERLERTESFARKHLHSDNVLMRPLRNMILRLVPNSLLAPPLKKRLFL